MLNSNGRVFACQIVITTANCSAKMQTMRIVCVWTMQKRDIKIYAHNLLTMAEHHILQSNAGHFAIISVII